VTALISSNVRYSSKPTVRQLRIVTALYPMQFMFDIFGKFLTRAKYIDFNCFNQE